MLVLNNLILFISIYLEGYLVCICAHSGAREWYRSQSARLPIEKANHKNVHTLVQYSTTASKYIERNVTVTKQNRVESNRKLRQLTSIINLRSVPETHSSKLRPILLVPITGPT